MAAAVEPITAPPNVLEIKANVARLDRGACTIARSESALPQRAVPHCATAYRLDVTRRQHQDKSTRATFRRVTDSPCGPFRHATPSAFRLSVQSCGYTWDVNEPGHPVDPERVELVRERGLHPGEAEAVARLLALLADPLRSRILSALLVSDELCVGDLAIALDASEDAVSYALRLLRTAALVRRRREGRMGYYRLRDGLAREELEMVLSRLRSLAATHIVDDTDDEN